MNPNQFLSELKSEGAAELARRMNLGRATIYRMRDRAEDVLANHRPPIRGGRTGNKISIVFDVPGPDDDAALEVDPNDFSPDAIAAAVFNTYQTRML